MPRGRGEPRVELPAVLRPRIAGIRGLRHRTHTLRAQAIVGRGRPRRHGPLCVATRCRPRSSASAAPTRGARRVPSGAVVAPRTARTARTAELPLGDNASWSLQALSLTTGWQRIIAASLSTTLRAEGDFKMFPFAHPASWSGYEGSRFWCFLEVYFAVGPASSSMTATRVAGSGIDAISFRIRCAFVRNRSSPMS